MYTGIRGQEKELHRQDKPSIFLTLVPYLPSHTDLTKGEWLKYDNEGEWLKNMIMSDDNIAASDDFTKFLNFMATISWIFTNS